MANSTDTSKHRVVILIDITLRELFDLLRRQDENTAAYEKAQQELKDRFMGNRSRIARKIDENRSVLRGLILANRAMLLPGKIKSFSTMHGAFSFRNITTQFRVTDPKQALDAARKLGIVRKVAKIKVSWIVDPALLQSYLESNPEDLEAFLDCIEPGGETTEHLSVKPEGFDDTDDSRISQKPIRLTD